MSKRGLWVVFVAVSVCYECESMWKYSCVCVGVCVVSILCCMCMYMCVSFCVYVFVCV